MSPDTGRIYDLNNKFDKEELKSDPGRDKMIQLEKEILPKVTDFNRKERRYFAKLVRTGMSQSEAFHQVSC